MCSSIVSAGKRPNYTQVPGDPHTELLLLRYWSFHSYSAPLLMKVSSFLYHTSPWSTWRGMNESLRTNVILWPTRKHRETCGLKNNACVSLIQFKVKALKPDVPSVVWLRSWQAIVGDCPYAGWCMWTKPPCTVVRLWVIKTVHWFNLY